MSDRAEVLEAALDGFPEGVCLLGDHGQLLFWNHAAQMVTGYSAFELVGRPYPDELRSLLEQFGMSGEAHGHAPGHGSHGETIYTRHKQGHDVATVARHLVLRDGLGHRIGEAVLFHPTESLDALPHGEGGDSENVDASQHDLKDRLESAFKEFVENGAPLGVLWLSVDQAHALRKTHGANACEAMLHKVERVMVQGLRTNERLGRWGEDEFLVISHERTKANLVEHAQALAGMTRTADFRWWGDRVSLTVSIGAAQADGFTTLSEVLEKARTAMQISHHAGGNHVTAAAEGHSCSPS